MVWARVVNLHQDLSFLALCAFSPHSTALCQKHGRDKGWRERISVLATFLNFALLCLSANFHLAICFRKRRKRTKAGSHFCFQCSGELSCNFPEFRDHSVEGCSRSHLFPSVVPHLTGCYNLFSKARDHVQLLGLSFHIYVLSDGRISKDCVSKYRLISIAGRE